MIDSTPSRVWTSAGGGCAGLWRGCGC